MPLITYRHVEKELDRALAEKQKLQMEIEDHLAEREEMKENKATLQMQLKKKDDEIKVIQCVELFSIK